MKTKYLSSISLLIILLFFSITACKDDSDDSTPAVKPIITSASPLTGIKGTEVTVMGSNFSSDPLKVSVRINGKTALLTFASESMLKFIVPAKAGTGNIVVVANGASTTGPLFNFIYTVSVSTYVGFSGTSGHVDGDVSVAKFNYPRGLAIDAQDNIYVADELNHCIRRISTGGTVVTFAGSGISGHADGDPGLAKFKNPYDVAVDEINGYYYVADKGNHCVRTISLSGYVTTLAGVPATIGYVDAPGASARFNNPTSLAVEGELANIYVTDAGNHCVRKIDFTNVVTTFVGSNVSGQLDGNGAAARFNYPMGITLDSAGFLYLTDKDNHNIRRISLGGSVITIAGMGTAGWVDGPGTIAQFDNPSGVYAEKGNLFVCDFFNNRIRNVSPGKVVTTIAGDGSIGFGDGSGDQAKFKYPADMIINSEGDYFVSDAGNHSIRKIVID